MQLFLLHKAILALMLLTAEHPLSEKDLVFKIFLGI